MSDRNGVVVVTGSAGGIGQAITDAIENGGQQVIGLDRAGIRPGTADRQIDLSDLTSLAVLAAELASEYAICGLVHNAAVQPIGGVGETSVAEWLEALKVNVLVVEVLTAAFRGRLAEVHGAVAVVSSVHARATTGGVTAYATTKAALEGWVRSAALDLGPGIRVNAIDPGAVDTPKLREGFERWGSDVARERQAILRDRTPLSRIATASEIADIVRFLIGPESAFMTGSVLTADGGATARLGSE